MASARSNFAAGTRQIPKASEHEAEVASGAGERGIVRPVDRLADGHRPLQLATRTREIPKISEYPAEFVVPLADLRVVGWKRRLGDGQGAFGHRPGLPRLPSRPQVPRGPAEQPPGRLTGHPQPLGMLRRGRHMRQQPLNHWPACHVRGVAQEASLQQTDRRLGPAALVISVQPGPQDRLDQPVQAQRVRSHHSQGIASQHPKRTVVGQRISRQLTQFLRQHLVVLAGHAARDLLGRQERAQAQQRLDRRSFPPDLLQ